MLYSWACGPTFLSPEKNWNLEEFFCSICDHLGKGFGKCCVLVQTVIFVLIDPKHLEYASSHQYCALKVCNIEYVVQHFTSPGKGGSWAVSTLLCSTVPRLGIMVRGTSTFPISFDVADFTLAQGSAVSQLVSEFFTKGICSCIIV